ncbi:MAG: dihydroneopterin aldolase [Parvibaculales bacterium]
MNKSAFPSSDSFVSARQGVMRVFIRDLELMMSIGIYPHEKTALQPVVFNLDLAVSELGADTPQNIDEVVCYDTIVKTIKALVKDTHYDLVETLAQDVADTCLTNTKIVRVRVRVEKSAAIQEAAGVGVEIERLQSQTDGMG